MTRGLVAAVAAFTVLSPVSTTTAHAGDPGAALSLPDNRLGIRTAPLLLLSRPDVRADLALDESQAAAVAPAIADLYARAAALRGKSGEEAVALRKAVDDAQRAWLDAHLNPEQRNRLIQIDLQWEGPSALISRPVVADTLGLTSEQRDSLRQAVVKRNAARQQGGDPKSEERTLAVTALKVLSPEQSERWRAMLGREFVPRLASATAPATGAAARAN